MSSRAGAKAQVSGVIHNVNVVDNAYNVAPFKQCDRVCRLRAHQPCALQALQHNQIGWGSHDYAGVKVNLPSFGAGDDCPPSPALTLQSAVWYSGLPDMMWGENGQVNGNGQPMYMQDAFFNPITNSWAKPTAWSVSGLIEHHFTPQFYLDLEGSVGQLKWSNQGGGCSIAGNGWLHHRVIRHWRARPSATTWLVGADPRLEPGRQPQLRPRVDVSEARTRARRPALLGTIYNWGQTNQFFVPGAWHGRQRWFRRPPQHHPLLLIASRSVETLEPRSESSAAFLLAFRAGAGHKALSAHIRGCARPPGGADDRARPAPGRRGEAGGRGPERRPSLIHSRRSVLVELAW